MTSENSRDLPPEALENLQMLQALRKAFWLSQEKLALKIGVSRSFIYSCESGRYTPSAENYRKLAEYFGWDKPNPPPQPRPPVQVNPAPVKPKPKPEPITPAIKAEKRPVKVSFTPDSNPCRPRINVKFMEGSCYEIHDNENVPDPMSLAIKQSRNSMGYIFRYEGMSAIYHVFRELRGKWIQTYTDAQLIGKYVREVEAWRDMQGIYPCTC